MNEQTNSILLQQLVIAAPMLIVTFVGLVLALIFIRKYTVPAVLTILAILAFWIAGGGIAFAQAYMFRLRLERGWTNLQYSQIMSVVSMSMSIVRALAIALLLAAVFVGRKSRLASGR
jgi:hypothetical protein